MPPPHIIRRASLPNSPINVGLSIWMSGLYVGGVPKESLSHVIWVRSVF